MKFFSFLLPFVLIGAISAQTPKADTIHSPKKATFLSLAIPSAGQFYNQIKKDKKKKNNLWWKLPIIYGGLGTSIYFLIDNQNEFNLIKDLRHKINSGTAYLGTSAGTNTAYCGIVCITNRIGYKAFSTRLLL